MRCEPLLDAFRGSAKIIRIVGHRGARGLFPENSMVGFENILKMGVTLIELDVVFSKDKTPIITHDHTINPSTSRDVDGEFVNENIKVSSLTVEQIKNYEIGRLDLDSDYGRRFPEQAQLDGIYMPTLQELFITHATRLGGAVSGRLRTVVDDCAGCALTAGSNGRRCHFGPGCTGEKSWIYFPCVCVSVCLSVCPTERF